MLFESLGEEVEEEGEGVVQLHLFVVERQTEGHGAEHIFIPCDQRRGQDEEAERDVVVLEVSVVDQNQTRM